jgi:5'-deoxynucleotidase YfbR-like HD superfamily hydrolase
LIGPISTHAITHDSSESISGDVVRPFKYSSKELKLAIDNAESIIKARLPSNIQKLMDCHEIILKTLGRPEEAKYVEDVVKAGDFLSLWMFMRREMMRGNREIFPFVDAMVVDLRSMADKFHESTPSNDYFSSLYLALAQHTIYIRGKVDVNYFVEDL